MPTCCRSSRPSANHGAGRRWCGLRTARRGCRRARSAAAGLGHRAVRVSDRPRCHCEKSGAAGLVDPDPEPRGAWGAVDPHPAHPAAGDRPGRGRRPDEGRTHRDRAMVQAMLLGGLRHCEVLGLRHTPAGTVCGSSTNKRVLTSAHIAHFGDGQGVDSSRCNPGVVTDRIDSSIAAGRWPSATWFDASSA